MRCQPPRRRVESRRVSLNRIVKLFRAALVAAFALTLVSCSGSKTPTSPTQNQPPAPSPAVCTYSVSPTSTSYPASSTIGSVAVTAPAGCNWSATSSANWITITAGSAGSGNGQVSFSVAANAATVARTGTLTVAQTSPSSTSATVTIAQAASTSPSGPEIRGNYTLEVQAAPQCNWSVATHRWNIVFSAPNPFELANNVYSVTTGGVAGNPDNGNPLTLFVSVTYRLPPQRSEIGINNFRALSLSGHFVFVNGYADGGPPTSGSQGRGEILNAVTRNFLMDFEGRACDDVLLGTNRSRVSLRPR